MTFLYVDTETSCLKDKRIVQLAAILATQTEEIASLNVLIKPDGWLIDPGAEAIHGISVEKAAKYGVPIESALWLFDSLAERADVMVCHNLGFDYPVVQNEYLGLEREFKKEGYCTMNMSRNEVKVPPTPAMIRVGRRGFKSPSLMEAHVWATGERFEGAHDALEDCRACLRVHRKLLEIQ